MKKNLIYLIILFSINIYSQGDAGVNLNPSNEIKFISDDIKYKSEQQAEPIISSEKKESSFFDLSDKVAKQKIRLKDFSDTKFKDAYKQNEDGTYSPKNNSNPISEETLQENYIPNNNDYPSKSMNDESRITVIIVVLVLIFLLLSEFLGRAKHIGRWWTFFLLLAGFIPGLIAVMTSPSAKKNPTQGGKSYAIWAWICLIFGILNAISLVHSEGKTGQIFYMFLILSFYLFELSKGLIINLNPKYYFDTKSYIDKQEEIKSFRNINNDAPKTKEEEKKLLQEILKFLEDNDKITLEIEFCDFQSSIYEGMKSIDLPTKLNRLNVYIVKSPSLGRITFFFRDSPKFVFSLTVDEEDLFNNINNNEIVLENFISLADEPIKGNKLTISNNMLYVNAYVINSTRLFDESNLTQNYFDAVSFKSYDYQLDFKTLTETPNIKNKPNNQQAIASDNKKNHSVYYVLIFIAIVIGLNTYQALTADLNNSINTEEPTVSIDTTAVVADTTATVIEADTTANIIEADTTVNVIEDSSNNTPQITSSYFFGVWRGTESEFTFYSNGDIYLKFNDGTEYWKKWKFVDNELYIESDGTSKRLYILDSEINSFSWRLEGSSNIKYFYRGIEIK